MLGTGHLPPEYSAVLVVGYNRDALVYQALAASQAEEDATFPDLLHAMELTVMVANSQPPGLAASSIVVACARAAPGDVR
jgi:hypothetical protein